MFLNASTYQEEECKNTEIHDDIARGRVGIN